MNGLSWHWIVVMATAPFLLGLLVALPIWRTEQFILGSLAGAAIIFGFALAMIVRESVEIDRVTRGCLDAGFTCWPNPPAFTRHAIYAFIGLIEVCGLFMLSLRVERRLRRRHYAPEWR